MADEKLSEQVATLESRAEELQAKARDLRDQLEQQAEEASRRTREKAEEVAETASRKVEEIQEQAEDIADEQEESGGGVKGLLMLVLAGVGAVGVYLKRKREQELDEALWEDPQAL